MKNIEYEYSFKVNDIKDFIKYLEDNNYKFISKTNQTRTLYRNKNKTMARVTIEEVNHKKIKKLDFKEEKLTNDDLSIRKETKSLVFTNGDDIDNILEFLGYYKDTKLVRERMIYEKDRVKFEIDKYVYPFKDYVVALEGDKKELDSIYNSIKDIIDKNKKID